jgi:predicted acetyltransferase
VNLTRVTEDNAGPVLEMVPAYLREIAPDLPSPVMDRIAAFWREKNRNAYLFGDPEMPDGFAMTRRITPRLMELCEFYIRPELRGWGKGRAAARAVVLTRRGGWRLGIARNAAGAAEFWNATLKDFPNITDLKAGAPLTPHQIGSISFIVKER